MLNKIQSYKKPFNYSLSENFLSKENLHSFFLLNEELKKNSTIVTEILNNDKLSKKRKLLRFFEKNKIIKNKNKQLNIFYKKIITNIKSKLNDKFYKSLGLDKKIEKKGFLNVSICWDEPGYYSKPHTDTQRKIWTGIIYLFNDKHKNSGTVILKKIKNKFLQIKTIKPKINKLFTLKRSNLSWHSVKKSKMNRIIILINFNFKNLYYEK